MKKYPFFCVVFVILALQMGPLTDAQADVVGRLSQVEGRVDILKGGQLPATPVKADDTVQPGDVLRTKSQSKAQITFIDNSTMTISPESRVAIEAFMFDAAQNKRNAVIELFKGLAYVVVSKVYQSTEPDFVVKTQTAIMGIRGTEFGIRLQPNSSDILNFKGRLQVGNVFPEVGQLPQRAIKVAYSFGSGAGSHWVFLDAMQGTTVAAGLPPTRAWTIYDEDRKHFIDQLGTGLNICRRETEDTETGGGPPSETISGCAPTTGLAGSDLNRANQDLLTAGFYGSWFTPPYTPPRDPKQNLQSPPVTLETTAGTTPPPPPPKPPCDHKEHHHFHWGDFCRRDHHDKCDFHFDWDFFCRRDRDDHFDFHFDRDFFCRRDHDNRFDFHFDRDSFSRRDRDSRFDFDFVKNFCQPKGHEGNFESFRLATLRTQHNLSDFHKTGPLSGHFRGEGLGSHITNFIQHAAITNPRLLLSQHCPGNGPGNIGSHRGGIEHAVVNLRDKCPPKGHINPGGQGNGAFQGGPPGNQQGPTPGPFGPKGGGV